MRSAVAPDQSPFALTLGPVLGFVDYGYMLSSFVADRFQYLAGIGVLAVLLGAAAHRVGKLPTWERLAAGMRGATPDPGRFQSARRST